MAPGRVGVQAARRLRHGPGAQTPKSPPIAHATSSARIGAADLREERLKKCRRHRRGRGIGPARGTVAGELVEPAAVRLGRIRRTHDEQGGATGPRPSREAAGGRERGQRAGRRRGERRVVPEPAFDDPGERRRLSGSRVVPRPPIATRVLTPPRRGPTGRRPLRYCSGRKRDSPRAGPRALGPLAGGSSRAHTSPRSGARPRSAPSGSPCGRRRAGRARSRGPALGACARAPERTPRPRLSLPSWATPGDGARPNATAPSSRFAIAPYPAPLAPTVYRPVVNEA